MNRQALIKFFTFLGGIYFFAEFLLPGEFLGIKVDAYSDQISKGLTAVVQMSVGLGLINLIRVHGSKIVFMRRGWANSAALIAGLAAMACVTIADWRGSTAIANEKSKLAILGQFADVIARDREAGTVSPEKSAERNAALQRALVERLGAVSADLQQPAPALTDIELEKFRKLGGELAESVASLNASISALQVQGAIDLAQNRSLSADIKATAQLYQERLSVRYRASFSQHCYQLLYEGFFISLGSAMFALLGFYMAAAAYRAFRIRSIESGLMMAAALLVMLGQIPFGLWFWDGFSDVRLWLLSTPSTAAFRAIKLGAAIAGLIMAFRMWLSIESESFEERPR